MKQALKKIAVWGYGSYGRKMVRQLRAAWSHRYEITAIFDRDYAGINRSGEAEDAVRDPGELEECCRQGLFASVMILVADYNQYDLIQEHLAARGIPTETVGRETDFLFTFQFPGAEERRPESLPEGYRCSVLRDLYAVRSCLSWAPLFLYDGAGRALEDPWSNSWTRNNPYQLDYPVPFDRPPARALRLAGQTCVVGKVWSGNYWHFTYDMLDQVYLLEKAGYSGRYIVPRREYTQTLLELLGIEPGRILWLEDLPAGQSLCLEELIMVTQEHLDRAAKAPIQTEMTGVLLASLLRETPDREYPSRVFVRRIGRRKLLGAEELLRKYGFTPIVPEELSVREQMLYFHHADIVLCPHGANSTNSLYMRPGSVFIETFGKNWVYPSCIPTLFLGGVHYLPVVEWPIQSVDQTNGSVDYSIQPPLLEMAIQNAITITER